MTSTQLSSLAPLWLLFRQNEAISTQLSSFAPLRLLFRQMASGSSDAFIAQKLPVVSELVCNAITHTESGRDGQVTIRLLRWDDRLRLVVVDDGANGKRPQERQENGAEGGRGIRIVKALACRWGFTEDGPRTVVWAEFKESVQP